MPCGREGDLSEVIQFQLKLIQLKIAKLEVSQCRYCTRHQYFSAILYMTRVKLVSNSQFFLNFYKSVYNNFENIPPQNKDAKVVSVHKICLIKLLLSNLQLKSSESSEFNFGFKQDIQMTRILFFRMVLRKFSEITNKKPIFKSVQYFFQLKIFLFSVYVLISFQSSTKNSIKSGTMQSVLQLALFLCFAVHPLRVVAMLFIIFS